MYNVNNTKVVKSSRAISSSPVRRIRMRTFLTFFAASIAVVLLLVVLWYVLQVVAYWRIFTKAGEKGWKSIIPFYNTYIQYKLTWKTSWFWIYAVLVIIGIFFSDSTGLLGIIATISTAAGGVVSILSSYKLSLAFGHGVGYAVGLVFINPIFMLILGLGDSWYRGPQDISIAGYHI